MFERISLSHAGTAQRYIPSGIFHLERDMPALFKRFMAVNLYLATR